MISSQQKKQLIFLLLSALWGYLIFYLSSVPNLASTLPVSWDFILRKMAHIFVFFGLSYLLANSFDCQQRRYLFIVIVAVISYALIDELHQVVVPGRHGSPKDIAIDSCGVFLGICLYKFKPFNKFRK